MALTSRGQIFKFEDLEFHAWGGVIVLHDNEKQEDICITASDFEDRAKCLQASLDREIYPHDRFKMQNNVDNMLACVKQARDQGDPTDPEVLAFYTKYSKKRPRVNGSSIATAGRQLQDRMRAGGVGTSGRAKTSLWTPPSYD